MQARKDALSDKGHYFNLDWLLRCINAIWLPVMRTFLNWIDKIYR